MKRLDRRRAERRLPVPALDRGDQLMMTNPGGKHNVVLSWLSSSLVHQGLRGLDRDSVLRGQDSFEVPDELLQRPTLPRHDGLYSTERIWARAFKSDETGEVKNSVVASRSPQAVPAAPWSHGAWAAVS